MADSHKLAMTPQLLNEEQYNLMWQLATSQVGNGAAVKLAKDAATNKSSQVLSFPEEDGQAQTMKSQSQE